ncbi:MAG TPA: PLD nuclease N-terminal domain-containing protein [Armatimonadota bacterium]|nr:PLD nuclease N-terminal domain-containing protein [Armatimonadota bacterium]
MGILEGLVGLIVSGFGILLTIFWIIAIIDCARRRFSDDVEKIVWILVIIFSHCIGSTIYWIFGRPRGRLVS